MIPHCLIFSGGRNPISSNSLLCGKIWNLLHHHYHSFPGSASFPSGLPLNIKPLCVCMLSCIWLFATPWTVAHQAPLTMGFSRQEYWSGTCLLHWQGGSLPPLPAGKPINIYSVYVSVKVKIAQSCLTFYDPMDCSPSGSSVHGILQARILEWVAIPFSRGSSQPGAQTQVSCFAGQTLYQSESPGAFKDHPKYFHRSFWRSALYPALYWVLRIQRSFRYLCTQSIRQLLSGTVGTQKLEFKSQCIFQNNYHSSIS